MNDKRIAKELVALAKELTAGFDESEIENSIRDHLSGTPRKTNERLMYNSLKREFRGLDRKTFSRIWEDLIDEKYLVPVGGNSYQWEM